MKNVEGSIVETRRFPTHVNQFQSTKLTGLVG